ncbi:MAG: peptide ABC transporter substrate-binding protein [Streptosporangiaceae bacterium]
MVAHRTRRLGLAAAVLAGVTTLAACGGGGGGGGNNAKGAQGKAVKGGTITFAEYAGAKPNWILPITPSGKYSVYTLGEFQTLMYRPLYYTPKAYHPVIDWELSLANKPTYSHDNKVVTIDMKHNYKWSNGKPVTARNVVFNLNLMKAAVKEGADNFGNYTPGQYPDNIKSAKATGEYQLTLHVTKSYNPKWFTSNQLVYLTPFPMAWDKTSADGETGDYDMTPKGAKKVYDFLVEQSKKLSTYDSNPLWQIVNGPWKLKEYSTTGKAVFKPNENYSGPYKPKIDKFVELPFTSLSAEFNQIKAGKIDVGYVPSTDFPQIPQIKRQGYNVFPVPQFSINYTAINFNNPDMGAVFRQLYFRQAMQHLVDQKGYIRAIYHGYAIRAYGPVPVGPSNPYASDLEKNGTYTFNVQAARKLLTSHGWSVKPGGASVCTNPGTDANQCGKGIEKGKKLSIDYLSSTSNPAIGQMSSTLKSNASKVGIELKVKKQPFNTLISIATACKPKSGHCDWQLVDWGGISFSTYPTGAVVFKTGGALNVGSWSDPKADKLINATLFSDDPNALTEYQNYVAKQVPIIWNPDTKYVSVAKDGLGADGETFKALGQYNLQPERWYHTK